MAEVSYIFFMKHHKDYRFCFLDDPAMEIKALDPMFRIRRNVHLGNIEQTGYGYQVFVVNKAQRMMMHAYLNCRGVKGFVKLHDGYAHAFDLERMRDINSTYTRAYFFTEKEQIDRHVGYSIHLEDSRMVDRIPISYGFLESVLERHRDLQRIRNMSVENKMSLYE